MLPRNNTTFFDHLLYKLILFEMHLISYDWHCFLLSLDNIYNYSAALVITSQNPKYFYIFRNTEYPNNPVSALNTYYMTSKTEMCSILQNCYLNQKIYFSRPQQENPKCRLTPPAGSAVLPRNGTTWSLSVRYSYITLIFRCAASNICTATSVSHNELTRFQNRPLLTFSQLCQ